ncbi:MAG: hypothetical protein J0I08_05620 [Rhizobiales bacterium]|nr:hypothetical protein [Hyphomicrobiales bacterium]
MTNTFSQSYYPCFSTRTFELRAYAECGKLIKDLVTPVVTLTRQTEATSFEESFAALQKATEGRRAIVSFDPTPRPVTSAVEAEEKRRQKAEVRKALGKKPMRERTERELERYAEIRRKTGGFNAFLKGLQTSSTWIELAALWQGMIPVVRLESQEDVSAQIAAAKSSIPLAFYIDSTDTRRLVLAAYGIAQLTNPSDSILIIDAGYVRGSTAEATRKVDEAFSFLRRQLGDSFNAIEKVLVSGSFPGSSLRDLPRILQMEERTLFSQLAETFDIRYGDNASIPRKRPQAGGNGWLPHVDLVLSSSDAWRIELDDKNSDPSGYVRCASATRKSEQWSQAQKCWGSSIIDQVADGDMIVDRTKYTVPGPWIAVRANQHITRLASRR